MESTYSNAVFDFVIFLPLLKHDSRAQIRQIFYDAMGRITGYTSLKDALAYDARERRTAKNGIVFTYDSNGNIIKQGNGLEFLYDHSGVFAVKYNGATYLYRKDAQANIIALLDSNGSVAVKYNYDAWGKCARCKYH